MGILIPRLLVAGTHSGVGKTTVTLALLELFRASGKTVQPFKAGPDYIDSGYLSAVADRPCRNLDRWLVPSPKLPLLFEWACRGANLSLAEGVMGLYDGVGATSERGSSAELAKQLQLPVILVVDASACSRSAAALVKGFVAFDRKLRIGGCIVNRVSGAGHYRLVKEGIERLAGVPVVGFLTRDERFRIPERHLGLVPASEDRRWKKGLELLVRQARKNVDLPALERIARSAEPLELKREVTGTRDGSHFAGPLHGPRSKVPIGVAMDAAFHFYYPENLELLEEEGAEVVPFSPLKDSHLPAGMSALYLGGGFPEIFAEPLSRNRALRRQIFERIGSGLPTYAECGGLMYLAQAIQDSRGKRYPMLGVIPAQVQMTDRLQNFGYQAVTARRATWLTRPGETARGHEFHHSRLTRFSHRRAPYEVRGTQSGRARLEGYAKGSVVASYIHLHFWNCPRWAKRFVAAAWEWQKKRSDSHFASWVRENHNV